MSTLKMRCPCGQLMQVGRDQAGGLCRCPSCGQQLRVPSPTDSVSPTPANVAGYPPDSLSPEVDSSFNNGNQWEAPPPSTPVSTGWQQPSKPSSGPSVAGVLLALFLTIGVAFLVCGGIGAWFLLRTSAPETAEVAGRFEAFEEPLATAEISGGDSNPAVGGSAGGPTLSVAKQFAAYAAIPDSKEAIGLIDQELFGQRVRGPSGSAQATTKAIEVNKLLSNFHRVSLEGTPGNGALRHWRVLGKTQFDGQDAVMLRYYGELVPPVKWISKDEMLSALIPLISFEQYWEATSRLHVLAPNTRGNFGNSIPQKPNANGLLFPRAGYLLLCFDEVNGEPKLTDLASAISRLRLSRASGELYLRDWEVITFGPGKRPESAAEPITATIFGELSGVKPNDQRSYDSMADFRFYQGGSASVSNTVADLPAEQESVRTYRIKDIAVHVRVGSPNLGARVEAFRSDFPGDLGADMVTACLPMVQQNFVIQPGTEDAVVKSAQRIYDQFQDPFALYVQWMIAKAQGDDASIERLFDRLQKSGFETAEMHRYRLEKAIDLGDAARVTSALAGLANYWDPTNKLAKQEVNKVIQTRWSYLSQRIEMASNDSTQRSGAQPAGRLGPMRNRPSGMGSRNPGPRQGTGTSPDRSAGAPSANRPPFGSRAGGPRRLPPSWSASAENTVTISINAATSFDVNGYAMELQEKLQARTYRASRSNSQGTIKLEFSGTLEEVLDAISFGNAEIESKESRLIRVQLEN